MRNLFNIGRICYGTGIAEIGLQAIYVHNFPYILSLPDHFPASARTILAIIFGIIFTLAGISIIFEKKAGQISLLFGCVLLALFCFYYIPYEFLVSANYMHFEDWENAAKELTFAGGAFVIAGCYPLKNAYQSAGFRGKLISLGSILFAITMIDYGTLHFLVGKAASSYVPAWIPWHLFWMYFCGAALLGSGIAIILKIKVKLIAVLLGIMILTWFIILHLPRVIVAASADMAEEITSAIFALAYGGIAFVIAGLGGSKR